MKRRLLPLLALLGAVLAASPASASLAPPVRIRWVGDWPAPASPGRELSGTFSIEASKAVQVEGLTIRGDGWTLRADAPAAFHLASGQRRVVVFRGVPGDPSAPIRIEGTANGMAFAKEFRLDAERLQSMGKPGRVRAERAPQLVGGKGTGPRTAGQSIRVRGRIMYVRQDQVAVEADNVTVHVMDDDSPASDEQIGQFRTDEHGAFDVTLEWDDCDALGCDDPDVYLVYDAENLVASVRHDDDAELYRWSTEENVIENFEGSEIDFGVQFPHADDAALHALTSVTRTHRWVQQKSGMNAPHVFVYYPAAGTNYDTDANAINVQTSEVWGEGTHAHEFGHHLTDSFSILQTPSYTNGFCDVPAPSHCVWCPENSSDAWQEGFASWIAARAIRTFEDTYGPVPWGINDWRYRADDVDKCQQDSVAYHHGATEGIVTALLWDISDDGNDDQDAGLPDCDMDVLTLGEDEIFTVFRDDDPLNIGSFITAFRSRWPQHDSDLWATIANNASALLFTQPPPSIVTQPEKCRTIRMGEPFSLTIQGDGALHRYRWRHNGEPIVDGAGRTGAFTKVLSFDSALPWMAGDYDCMVTTCDGSMNLASAFSRVEFQWLPDPRSYLAWGENLAGQVGDGTTSNSRPATVHPNMTDIIEIEGGREFSMALRRNGKLLTWGRNNSGELGHPGFVPQLSTPTEVAALDDVVRIAAGKAHSLALLRDGTVRSWGWGFRGALGNGDFNGRSVPDSTLDFPTCVREIAASDDNSYFLLEDLTVWATGLNDYGNLGRGFTGPRDGVPQAIPGLTNVIAIEAGGQQAMALKADGTVWVWGINHWGQLGLGHFGTVTSPTQVPGLANITQISVGLDNCYALRNDGIAFAAGYGPALGQGWNGGGSWTFLQIPLTNITRIQGGADWAAVLIDGRLKAFGNNASVNPPDVGVFNTTSNYITGTPTDVPQVHDITTFGAGWGTLHAIGSPGIVDVPIAGGDRPAALALAVGPNPVREMAAVRFELPVGGHVALAVYDVAGRAVKTLADEPFEAGRHSRPWDGATNAGARAPSGVYFVKMTAPGGALTRTLVRID